MCIRDRRQVHAFDMSRFCSSRLNDYSVTLTFNEFCDRYGILPAFESLHMLGAPAAESKMRVSDACAYMNWTDAHVTIGMHKVFLSHAVFRELEDELRARDTEEMQYQLRKSQADDEDAKNQLIDPYSPYADMAAMNEILVNPHEEYTPPAAYSSWGEYDDDETRGLMEGQLPDEELLDDAKDAGPGECAPPTGEMVTERLQVSNERRLWVATTWLLTFWIPSFVLKRFKWSKRSDVRMAWREKLAINMLIWFVCAASIFVIVFLGNVNCPKEHLYSSGARSGQKGKDAFTAVRGEVFNLNGIIDAHLSMIPIISRKVLMQYAGQDATSIFPVQVNALCNGPNGPISQWVTMDSSNSTDPNAKYHDFRAYRATDVRPDWYYEQMWYMRNRYRVGFIGYTPKEIEHMKEHQTHIHS